MSKMHDENLVREKRGGMRACPDCEKLVLTDYFDTIAGICVGCRAAVDKKQDKLDAVSAPRMCRMCGETKPIAEFYTSGTYCISCKKLRSQEQTLIKHGLVMSEYLAMSDSQDGRCEICGEEETTISKGGGIKLLTPYRDNRSNTVKILLCNRCFLRLRPFTNDIEWLFEAADNLRY